MGSDNDKPKYNYISATSGFLAYFILSIYALNKKCMYAFNVSLLLAFSSVLFHLNNKNFGLYVFDQICIFNYVLTCLLNSYFKLLYFMIFLFAVSYSCFVYYYGKTIDRFCHDKDECVGHLWQSTIHIVSSISFAYVL
jgi:hypothetical protein